MTDHATPPPAPANAPVPGKGADPVLEALAAPVAEPFAAAEDPAVLAEQEARRTRRRKAAVRWSCAVLVFALAGTGSALAVTAPDRTDLPGLATASDGRYTFAPLTLPPLPAGQEAPDDKGKSPHHADLRYLLLPAPKEAGGSLTPPVFPAPTAAATPSGSPTASPSAPASPAPSDSASAGASASASAAGSAFGQWVPCDAIADEQQDPVKMRSVLLEHACRAATVREWTASDGTRTQIRLLRFGSVRESWGAFADVRSKGGPKAAPSTKGTPHDDWDALDGSSLTLVESTTAGTKGAPTARVAYLSAADVVAVITMTNPAGVPTAPFRQVVTLQGELLG
ncbi:MULTISPECIES: hypothetical protein [Streptomycetaceae]|uniref:hypothetical protein n=1 Tax=Streptomycetaceae TaxID=2062 RepID=UPI00093A1FAA|nr:hypothetical protein [Streptomyces sp. CB02056]OKI00459.1 hypothetical protein AMK13_32670 [Streptomyces sp. CB02056]